MSTENVGESLVPGRYYDPVTMADAAVLAATYHGAQATPTSDLEKRAKDLQASIAKAWEQSERGADYSKVVGFTAEGGDVAATIMAKHSEWAGLRKVIGERVATDDQSKIEVVGQTELEKLRIPAWDNMVRNAKTKGLDNPTQWLEARYVYDNPVPLSKMLRNAMISAAPESYLPGVVMSITRPKPTVYDIIPKYPSGEGDFKWFNESARSPQAAGRAASTNLPESSYTISKQSTSLEVLGHFNVIAMETMRNVPFLRAFIEDVMPSDLRAVIDEQLIKGDGTSPNLQGLSGLAGTQSFDVPWVTPNTITNTNGSILASIMDAQYDYYTETNGRCTPTHLLVHPDFAKEIHTSRHDSGFFYGGPESGFMPIVWGMPMILNTQIQRADAAGNAIGLMVDFGMGMKCFMLEREGMTFDWAADAGTEYKNLTRLCRAFQQVGLVVTQPKSIAKFVTKA